MSVTLGNSAVNGSGTLEIQVAAANAATIAANSQINFAVALPVLSGGTGVTTKTGTGAVVLGTSPSISGAVMSTMASSVLTSTSVATSGTTIPFTGIPSWVKRITVMFGGLATNGTAQIQVQLGSGSTTATGYASNSHLLFSTSGIGESSITTGFPTSYGLAGQLLSGNYTITNVTGNLWVCSGSLFLDTSRTAFCGGRVTLAGVLDRVVISTVGADTFNAGSVSILYE